MRLFVAIDLDEHLKEKVLQVQKKLEQISKFADLRLVERKNFHLTLKFLGEAPDNSVTNISERLKSIANGTKPFKISISGLSFFTPSNIRVIFLDVKEGEEKIIGLEKTLNEKLKDIRKEDYDSHPHLTIARVGFVLDKNRLLEKLKEMEKVEIGEMEVKEIKLFRSELTGKGPVYTVVKNFNLG